VFKGARTTERPTDGGMAGRRRAISMRWGEVVGGVARKEESGVASLLAPAFYGGGASATPLSS